MNQSPTPEKLAEWWVLLSCWVWPDDLPNRPLTGDLKQAIRGAHAVVSMLADEALVDAIWQDEPARVALVSGPKP